MKILPCALLLRLAGGAAGSLGLEAPNGCLLICVLQVVCATNYLYRYIRVNVKILPCALLLRLAGGGAAAAD